MKKIFSSQNKKGFTLVEVIVAVGIFSIVMTIALGAIIAIVGANKKAQAFHNVINNFNLAVESMVRDMRTGYDYVCGSVSGIDCAGETEFSFKTRQINDSEDGVEVTYRLNDQGQIEKGINGTGFVAVTGNDVTVEKMSFSSGGINDDDNVAQPVILVLIKGKALVNGQESQFNIQTLVSQRLLDL